MMSVTTVRFSGRIFEDPKTSINVLIDKLARLILPFKSAVMSSKIPPMIHSTMPTLSNRDFPPSVVDNDL